MRTLISFIGAFCAALLLVSCARDAGAPSTRSSVSTVRTAYVDVMDSGTGSTLADAAFRSVGAPDPHWVADVDRADTELEIGRALESATPSSDADISPVRSLKERVRSHADARVVAWEFSDASVLQYHFRVDEQGSRVRLTAVSVIRP